MSKQLDLKEIVVIGRTFEEYCKMFDLNESLLKSGFLLDVASGASSFCAEANAKGHSVIATDKIYAWSADRIGEKCRKDLDTVIERLLQVKDLYIWDFFKDIEALKKQRETAYKAFIQDFKKHGRARYLPVEYPPTTFQDDQFTVSLVSHFLFLYENHLDYDFHKKTILELLRITSKEVRIFPTVPLNGGISKIIGQLMKDKDFADLEMHTQKVDYEFMKNRNTMLVIKK